MRLRELKNVHCSSDIIHDVTIITGAQKSNKSAKEELTR